ncbi:sensor histidine kinase [Roseovarius salinarum]|uniref:sensor histidine kinase n=1 Tax=Roseovarius salinarum TaxID=1981892 RepID=UPI000C324103|nr:ATP-binding protein [Roseovarius salinarum]
MSTEEISALLEAIPLPAVLIGQGERILGANRHTRGLLGEGIVGRHFITALRQPTVLDAIEACLSDHEPRKTRFLSSDGAQDTTFVVSCAFVETRLGSGVLVCFEDITHFEQAGQMRRDFVANVSHELRTPLTALLGFIETLRGPARNDPEAAERFLATMQTEAMRMERLVKDLLSLSRVESEERVRPTDRVDLAQVLTSVQQSLQPLADEAGVTLTFAGTDQPAPMPGDSDQLHQVFTNLLENAIKYGGAGTQVTVDLETVSHEPALRGPAVIARVRDTGPGIAEVHIPRLTERFYRVDSHRSREMGGTGLGLAIVKHIINRHRGRLRIDSTPGEGTQFTVIVPCDIRG